MRRLRARKVDSANGEVHFIIEGPQASEHSERFKDYDVFEIKKVTRKEAAKPLALLREE
jgi:hypothetical protein